MYFLAEREKKVSLGNNPCMIHPRFSAIVLRRQSKSEQHSDEPKAAFS